MTTKTITAVHPIIERFNRVRSDTDRLAEPYSEADQTVQSMPDASPVKWHLAHTSWFFETFLLKPHLSGYRHYDPHFEYLFNSYYNSVGMQYPRAKRGLISRPGKDEVLNYRGYVNDYMGKLFSDLPESKMNELVPLIELGLAHEQQHQELLVTDILHALSHNPIHPKITERAQTFDPVAERQWQEFQEGIYLIGNDGSTFCFDNEMPRHKTYLHRFKVSDRLITNGEYLDFIHDGGYQNPLLWLSEGWAWKNAQAINAPLYWQCLDGDQWYVYSLAGLRPIDKNAPVSHISYFEANAFAQWAQARLLTEQEWEVVAQTYAEIEHGKAMNVLQPRPQTLLKTPPVTQLYNTLWQWTTSQYLPYPGFKAPQGAIGEYNGKFMSNQFVLRGGSCVTPTDHIRSSYRNFFPATARWQFTGIRIAIDD